MGFAVVGRGILTLRNAANHHVIHSHDSQSSIAWFVQIFSRESRGSIIFHRIYSLLLQMVLIMGAIATWPPLCMFSRTWEMEHGALAQNTMKPHNRENCFQVTIGVALRE